MKIKYLIPNLFTSFSLISGLIALNLIIDGKYHQAAWFIALAMIIDGLDGKLARMLKASSNFGALYDTLSDFVVFGIVPAVMIFRASLITINLFGILATLFYVFCGAYRLIRYTVTKDKNILTTTFLGLPIPAAAGIIVTLTLINDYLWDFFEYPILIALITLFISILMISRIRYSAIEKESFSSSTKAILSFVIIISIFILTKFPVHVFSFWICSYVIFGLFRHLFRIIHK